MTALSDSASAAASRASARTEVRLRHEAGLHARPAVKLTKLAKKFVSRISMSTSDKGPWIDAKSIVKVMSARTPRNTMLYFRAEGADAEHAVQALAALVEQDFPDDG
jgi:phosphocarrier protein HPr